MVSYGDGGTPPQADPAWASLLTGPPSPEIARLRDDITRFAAAPRTPRQPTALADDLPVLRHCIDLLELQFAQRAAEFAASDQYEQFGSLSAETWIHHACHMSGVAAADAVRAGQQMTGLPESTSAVLEGRIGFAHLSLLASTAAAAAHIAHDMAASDASARHATFDERPLLRLAEEHSVSRFRHDCAHARHASDPAGFLAQHVNDEAWRVFEIVPCSGGVLLRGQLDEAGGATLRSALEPLAKKSGTEDTRRRRKRMADALVELANHGMDSGVLPSQAGQRPHVQVTATLDTLAGAPGAPAGELEYAHPVPAATVQRLACDASVTRVVLDAASAIVDVGRARRIPAPATRRALVARDKGCAWPRCERPPSWTAAHHLHHWAHGGRTDLENLALLCHRHHFLMHEGGWRLIRSGDGPLLALPPFAATTPAPACPLPSEVGHDPAQRAQGYTEMIAPTPQARDPVST